MARTILAFMAGILPVSPLLAGGGHRVVATELAPAAIGPYSQAVMARDTLYISGQLGLVPETGKMAGDDTPSQARQALKNLTAILGSAALSTDDLVMVQIYLTDMADYAAVNEIYGRLFTGAPPARAVVQVAGLPKSARVEIAAIAVKR